MSTELQMQSLELLSNIQQLDILTQALADYAREIQMMAERLKVQEDD